MEGPKQSAWICCNGREHGGGEGALEGSGRLIAWKDPGMEQNQSGESEDLKALEEERYKISRGVSIAGRRGCCRSREWRAG